MLGTVLARSSGDRGISDPFSPPPQGLEVPLVAVIQWSTPKLPFTSSIYTHYR